MSEAQLDRIAQQIRAADARQRHDAAAQIAALPPEAFPTLIKRLERAKQTTPDHLPEAISRDVGSSAELERRGSDVDPQA